jgi:hypothetical protein
MADNHHFVVRLSPREYAAVLRLVVANDVLGSEGAMYMDLEIKAALARAKMESGAVQAGDDRG